jgi:hypothetical protein
MSARSLSHLSSVIALLHLLRLLKISGLAIHQAPQICFDTAATDERDVDLACIFEGSSRPVFE